MKIYGYESSGGDGFTEIENGEFTKVEEYGNVIDKALQPVKELNQGQKGIVFVL